MSTTDNLQGKKRLSLSKGFPKHNQKSELSQHHVKSDHPILCRNSNLESPCRNNSDRTDRSPSLISMSSDDCATENTPPRQRKMPNLDDSGDYDNSRFSPSLLMSQTVTIESPEIGWKWDCSLNNNNESATTTDAARSEVNNGAFTPIRLKCNEMRRHLRMRQRKKLEQKLRQERRMQTEKTLQERCAKLQLQLKLNDHINSKHGDETVYTDILRTTHNSITILKDNYTTAPASLNYFDNSISDELLVAATQKVEAQLCLTQNNPCNSTSNCKSPITTTSYSDLTKKCPAISSKFFGNDDDDADDWIFQIDENSLQTKPKTPLQRYKSLPVNSRNISNEDNNSDDERIGGKLLKGEETNSHLSNRKLKRHVSINGLSITATTKTLQ